MFIGRYSYGIAAKPEELCLEFEEKSIWSLSRYRICFCVVSLIMPALICGKDSCFIYFKVYYIHTLCMDMLKISGYFLLILNNKSVKFLLSVVETAYVEAVIGCRNMSEDIRNRKNGRNMKQ
jgi:hypothetical protein